MAGSSGRSTAVRIGAAAVAMVLVAEAAVWLLRPREQPIEPAPVSEADYFTPAQIERGRAYGNGQLWLLLGAVGAQGAVLVTLALGRPAVVRRGLQRLEARPVLGAAAAGAGLSVALGAAALPARIAAHERAVDYGISTQSLSFWLADTGKSAAIGAALAAGGAALLIAFVRRFGGRWWMPGSLAVVAMAAVFVWLAPVVLAPLFNRFSPLPAGSRARTEVMALGSRAGVEIGQVYSVDASRRGRSLNAYVGGIGSTKRVVLYDTLLDRANRGELRSIVAHELGHVKHDDILRGLAFVALVAPLGLLFVREVGDAAARRAGSAGHGPAALPAYALGLAVASLLLGVVGNQLSRRVEVSADTYALELTNDPRALIQVQRRLAIQNVADPDPPAVATALVRTHPSTIDRIGAAIAYERGAR
jgi:STE24 endopeptidase